MTSKVLVVGSAAMELSLNVYKMPEAGERISDDGGVAYIPAGKGTRGAVALKRLGADPVLSTKLSADLHGRIIYDFYRAAGLDCSHVMVERDADYPTALSVIIREGGAERRICYPGVSTRITQENIYSSFAESPDALLVSLDAGVETALTSMKIAYGKGVPVFLDATPADRSVQLENFPTAEVIFFNEQSTLEYTGQAPAGADASLRASLALWRRVKAKYIVIKQGQRGASIYDGKHFDMVSPPRVDKVVDASLAGDTFNAAFITEYLRTGEVKGAAKYGTVAAAIAVSRAGTVSSVPTEEEVRAFISR